MYALCSDAMLKAITRQARAVDDKVKEYNNTHTPTITIAYFFDHLATEEDTAVLVTEPDFIEAHNELVPSVSADELQHYERVRRQFEGAGKKEEEKRADAVSVGNEGPVQPDSNSKGKGKARATVDEDEMVIHTGNIDLNGGSSGKGKGKASAVGHGSKSSLDIAEGGFGDAGDDDDLYA
jgi:peroxin-6